MLFYCPAGKTDVQRTVVSFVPAGAVFTGGNGQPAVSIVADGVKLGNKILLFGDAGLL